MLSPMMQCAGRIRVKDCPFGTPDGTANQFQLVDRHGHAVTKDVRIASIHQTDWQGRFELSDQPRTNYLWPSAPGQRWGFNLAPSVTRTPGLPDPDGTNNATRAVFDTDSVGPTGPYFLYSNLPVPVGTVVTFEIALRGIAGGEKLFLHAELTDLKINITLSTEWQVFRITAPTQATNAFTVYTDQTFYAGSGFEYACGGAYDKAGAYIPTTGSPATVTDYTHDGQGGITTGQVPAADATLDWTGSARRAA